MSAPQTTPDSEELSQTRNASPEVYCGQERSGVPKCRASVTNTFDQREPISNTLERKESITDPMNPEVPQPDGVDRSEEVQSIIDRMPTYWTRYVALLTFALIVIVLILGFLIKYPDTVDGQISLTSHQAPVRLVANTNGKLHLICPNGAHLHKDDVIGYIESGANYEDILRLDSLLRQYFQQIDIRSLPDTLILPTGLILGDVSSKYNTFVVAYEQYKRVVTSDIYSTMRVNLENTIQLDEKVVVNLQHEIQIRQRILDSTQSLISKDSMLLAARVLSPYEYKQQYNELLNLQQSMFSQKSNILSKQSSISQNRLEIQRICLEESEARDKVYADLITSKNELENSISVWEERYLEYAPSDGELEYLGFWRDNSFVSSGEELFEKYLYIIYYRTGIFSSLPSLYELSWMGF